TRTCKEGQAIFSIRGRAAAAVDRIQLGCRSLDAQGRTTGSDSWLTAVGGSGGKASGPNACTQNRPAKAVQGKSGLWIDQIRLACAYPNVPAVTPVKRELCFGAIGAQCGAQQGLAGFCA